MPPVPAAALPVTSVNGELRSGAYNNFNPLVTKASVWTFNLPLSSKLIELIWSSGFASAANPVAPTLFLKVNPRLLVGNAPEPTVGKLFPVNLMLVNPVQPEKADDPMLVTPEVIVMLVNPRQPEKAESSMLVTLEGIVMLVNPLQP